MVSTYSAYCDTHAITRAIKATVYLYLNSWGHTVNGVSSDSDGASRPLDSAPLVLVLTLAYKNENTCTGMIQYSDGHFLRLFCSPLEPAPVRIHNYWRVFTQRWHITQPAYPLITQLLIAPLPVCPYIAKGKQIFECLHREMAFSTTLLRHPCPYPPIPTGKGQSLNCLYKVTIFRDYLSRCLSLAHIAKKENSCEEVSRSTTTRLEVIIRYFQFRSYFDLELFSKTICDICHTAEAKSSVWNSSYSIVHPLLCDWGLV